MSLANIINIALLLHFFYKFMLNNYSNSKNSEETNENNEMTDV